MGDIQLYPARVQGKEGLTDIPEIKSPTELLSRGI